MVCFKSNSLNEEQNKTNETCPDAFILSFVDQNNQVHDGCAISRAKK